MTRSKYEKAINHVCKSPCDMEYLRALVFSYEISLGYIEKVNSSNKWQ